MRLAAPMIALLVAGCSPSTVGPGSTRALDVLQEGALVDTVVPETSGLEGGAIEGGAIEGGAIDMLFPVDGGTVDVPFTSDGTGLVDASGSLRGLWRVVRYEFVREGRPYTLTDRDGLIETGMGASRFRVNGLLYLDTTHLASTFGVLAEGHFYTYTPMAKGDRGYTANGHGIPGVLDEGRAVFEITGAPTPTRFARNADGTLAFVDPTSGVRIVYARTNSPGPALASVNAPGLVVVAEGVVLVASRPRVALLWDLPGEGRWLESNGSALRFMGRFASFPLTLTTAPEKAIVPWRGSRVAVARVVVYDDTDNDLSFDLRMDRLLALSPMVVTWRASTPFAATGSEHFPLRHVPDGFRYGHAHIDFALGREDVVPFDHTVPPSPGVPVFSHQPGGIPEIF
jgi:hypothetical protein